jgi:hypothetical protein
MTKLSFDVDLNQDPDKILDDIKKRAAAELAKHENKVKENEFLSNLHHYVNKEIGTNFSSISSLLRELSKFASNTFKEKVFSVSSSGRRKTISMNKEIFKQIKSLLSQPNPNKAAIARKTGVSVVQVRKVASGGYDKKFDETLNTQSPNLVPGMVVKSPLTNLEKLPSTASLDAEEKPPTTLPKDTNKLPPLPEAEMPKALSVDSFSEIKKSPAGLPSPSFGNDESNDDPSKEGSFIESNDDSSKENSIPLKPSFSLTKKKDKSKSIKLTRPPIKSSSFESES